MLTHIHVLICIYIYICMCIFKYTHVYTYICIYVYIHICIRINIHTGVCVCGFAYIYLYVWIDASHQHSIVWYIYVCIQIYTQSMSKVILTFCMAAATTRELRSVIPSKVFSIFTHAGRWVPTRSAEVMWTTWCISPASSAAAIANGRSGLSGPVEIVTPAANVTPSSRAAARMAQVSTPPDKISTLLVASVRKLGERASKRQRAWERDSRFSVANTWDLPDPSHRCEEMITQRRHCLFYTVKFRTKKELTICRESMRERVPIQCSYTWDLPDPVCFTPSKMTKFERSARTGRHVV